MCARVCARVCRLVLCRFAVLCSCAMCLCLRVCLYRSLPLLAALQLLLLRSFTNLKNLVQMHACVCLCEAVRSLSLSLSLSLSVSLSLCLSLSVCVCVCVMGNLVHAAPLFLTPVASFLRPSRLALPCLAWLQRGWCPCALPGFHGVHAESLSR